MGQPLVSVVIPCYNHENFVQDCIQSVIDQTYQNIELIIIDDGSSDNSVAEIQEMIDLCQKRFVRFDFIHRNNKGLCNTLNEALDWCKGKYFSIIASDDVMLPIKSTIQVEYLERNLEVMAILGGVYWVDENENIVKVVKSKYKIYNFKEIFLSKQKLNACTQMTRLDVIKSIGGYPQNFIIEDWYMWLKISQIGLVVNLDIIFTKYRLHEENTIKKGEMIYKGMMEIADEYKFHPLYFRAIKQIIWIRVAAIILNDRLNGWIFFKELFKADFLMIFHKNFYRCLRNFFK